MNRKVLIIAGIIIVVLVLFTVVFPRQENQTVLTTVQPTAVTLQPPPNAVEISMLYSGEVDQYMPQIMERFNNAYIEGRNPLTGATLAEGERPIFVSGEDQSSGDVLNLLLQAAAGNREAQPPTMWNPSVSHFLALANFRSGQEVCDLTNSRATALAPVVIAIWESRLDAIRETIGDENIGWEDLLDVLDSPNGWQDYGLEGGRRSVYYGHTNPRFSPTGLSTLLAEFYVSARRNGFDEGPLTLDMINNAAVQQGVREIENLIRHYSRRTTEFTDYIAQGPDYLDFVALEENDVIAINRGLRGFSPPPERLVALYPSEGSYWHEHPVCILNGDWVSSEQRRAAEMFVDYVLTEENQEYILSFGLRPANPAVQIGYPFEEENGVLANPSVPSLPMPATDVVARVQDSWQLVKKQADIMLVIDVSGSMASENRLSEAQFAAIEFVDNMECTNRLGLTVFSDTVRVIIPLSECESVQEDMIRAIQDLQPAGNTALYEAVHTVVETMNQDEEGDRIRAVILLSDGQNTSDGDVSLAEVIASIEDSHEDLNPVIVIPIAYGSDADMTELNSIARASNTRTMFASPETIQNLLNLINSFF